MPRGQENNCPNCRKPLERAALARIGVLHPRSEREGGPFYTLCCTHCGTPLVGEPSSVDRSCRYLAMKDLAAGTRQRRALRSFRGLPQQPGIEPEAAGDEAPVGEKLPQRPPPGEAFKSQLAKLDLTIYATMGEIKQRYRELVKELHPDRNQHLSHSEQVIIGKRFIQISEAYREVSQGWPAKRP